MYVRIYYCACSGNHLAIVMAATICPHLLVWEAKLCLGAWEIYAVDILTGFNCYGVGRILLWI